MKNIAIIPARSGSKGLVDKNIKELKGKPLIAYSIEAAIKSEKFEEIMVSTDSELYAEIARKYGAKVPFLRSAITATDSASSWDVVEEVLSNYTEKNTKFDTFCLLQPTSPLRSALDIIKAYELFEDKAACAVVSVCETEHSPLWCGTLPEDGNLSGFVNNEALIRRQELDTYYRLNGAIYIVDCIGFRKDKNVFREGSYAYIMPQERSVDIDTSLDFKYVETLIQGK